MERSQRPLGLCHSLPTCLCWSPWGDLHKHPLLSGHSSCSAAWRAPGMQAERSWFSIQLSQRLNMWPSVPWSSHVKTKPEFKTRNALRTRCSSWAKPFWVNILQRSQITAFQTLGICVYWNVYKILLFLDNRFTLQKSSRLKLIMH